MNTGIIYISKHGTTEKVAKIIAAKLNLSETILIDLRKVKVKEIKDFDRIIIGGSIHMGTIHKKSKKFCKAFHTQLLKKEVGLFLCCMEKGEKATEQFNNSFSEELRNHAKSSALLGFEYNLDKMKLLEKALVKKISGSNECVSEIDHKAICSFTNELVN